MCELLNAINSFLSGMTKEFTMAIITGIYSGLIVTKYTEFRNLREEATRILYRGLSAQDCSHELKFIALSLERLGHKASAKKVRIIADDYIKIVREIKAKKDSKESPFPTINEAKSVIDKNNELRLKISSLRPSWIFIILPRLQ